MIPAIRPKHFRPTQGGTVLIMAMTFLLILSLIGVTSMTTVALEEKMSGNMSDKNVAFQTAESALVAGEIWVGGQMNKPVFDPAVTNDGLHLPSATSTPVWDNTTGVWSSGDLFSYPALNNVSVAPSYIIEDLGAVPDNNGSLVLPANYKSSGKNVFRVTARANGRTDATVAMIQSVYEKRF
ncbi:MAG: PilX N-terminal domain-containing pilus assembly protein [Acidiferrobacterales bacterium]